MEKYWFDIKAFLLGRMVCRWPLDIYFSESSLVRIWLSVMLLTFLHSSNIDYSAFITLILTKIKNSAIWPNIAELFRQLV